MGFLSKVVTVMLRSHEFYIRKFLKNSFEVTLDGIENRYLKHKYAYCYFNVYFRMINVCLSKMYQLYQQTA